jgi:hypothetical protein
MVGLTSPAVLEYDAHTNFMAALRYHGSGLFANDLIADTAGRNGALGWDAVCWLWTLFFDPVWLSKLAPFALFGVTLAYAFRLGRRFGGVGLACAFCLMITHTPFFWMTMVGGLPRSFAFPSVIAWLYYAACGRHRAALATLGCASLFYPPTFLVLAAAHGLWVVRRRDRWLPFALVCAGGAALYMPKAIANAREFGANPGYREALARPDLGPGGCTPAWPLPPALDVLATQAIKPYRSMGGQRIAVLRWPARKLGELFPLILLGGLMILLLVRGRAELASMLPSSLPLLLAGGLSLYVIARVASFHLYYADRYSQSSVEPTSALALPILLAATARFRLDRRWGGIAAALGTGAILFFAYGDGLVTGLNLMDERNFAPDVLRVLASQPRDAVIAAPMRLADSIPLAIHRRVYLKEGAVATLPGGEKWYRELDHRLRAQFSAYYAADADAVADFARREHVDVMVVDARDFGPAAVERARFWEPWGSWLQGLVRNAPRFALADPPRSAVVYHRSPWIVVDLNRLGATPR